MRTEYDTCTKDKNKLSYCVLQYLLKLGFNPSLKGTIFFKDVILYIYTNDIEFYSIKSICKILAKQYHSSEIVIYKSIVYAIQNINYEMAKTTFYSLFGTDYQIEYFLPKALAILLKTKLEQIENSYI